MQVGYWLTNGTVQQRRGVTMVDHNRKALGMWDGWSRGRAGVPAYDPWLDAYAGDLKAHAGDELLDLGCGIGADTWYLLQRGYDVLSADYSREALRSIEAHLGGSKTAYVDMNERLPFPDGSFGVIVSSMALHYFDEATTCRVMDEIRRVLAPGGVLLARVSSMNDVAYGAGSGRQIEPHFFDHGSYAQRYLTSEDVSRFFGRVGELSFRETAMTRDEAYYSVPKMLWEIRCQK